MATELVLTTVAKIQTWLSAEGLENRTDHSADALVRANNDALGEIEFYLSNRYQLSNPNILASRWLQTVVECFTLYHLMSQRNDQPAANIVAMHDRYLEQLEQIRKNEADFPAIPQGPTGVPFALNMRIDHSGYPALQVDKNRSMFPDTPKPIIYSNEFPRPSRS